MADRFDVETPSLPYGSVGGAASRAMQTELLRRLQMEEAARAEALRLAELKFEHERLLRGDTRQAEIDAVNKQVALENLASNKEAREALSESRRAATHAAEAKLLTAQTKPGKISTERAAQLRKNPLTAGLVLSTPKVDMPVAEGLPAALGGVDAPSPTLTADDEYLGTPEQAEETKTRQFVDDLVAGKLDADFADRPDELQAAKIILRASGGSSTGLASALAGLFKAPKPPAETQTARTVQIEKDFFDAAKAAGKSDADARVEARKKVNELQALEAGKRQETSIRVGFDRQERGFGQQNKSNLINAVEADQKVYQTQADASVKGINLLDAGGTADMAAVSQFLTATSGGFGSGQRINDTELNAVLNARSWIEDFQIASQKARLDGKPVNKLSPVQRTQMKQMLQIALKDAVLAIEDNIATARAAGDEAMASHWEKMRDRVAKKGGLAPLVPAEAAGARTPVGRFDPATGKVVR